MTRSSDGWDDMRDEQPFDDPLLTDLLAELRSWGTGPAPEPSPALAALFEDAEQPAPAPSPVPATPRRKRNMLVSKLAALGVAAKIALGVGVAAAAVTTAGVAGALPGPAQRTVASVLNAVSPVDLPSGVDATLDANADADDVPDVTVPSTTVVTLPGDDDTGDDPVVAAPADNHGACVSAIAKDRTVSGREHGEAVSTAAKSDCGKDETTSTTSSTSTTSTSVPGDDDTGQVTGNRGPGNSSGHGNGNGTSTGNGNGNGANGNGGGSGGGPKG